MGLNAWGGPVAQIAHLRELTVEKLQWVNADKFRRMQAVYQILPGPEACEMCIAFGMMRAGRLGAVAAGLGFLLPGFIFMLALSVLYFRYGSSVLLPFFVGVAPAVAALIVRAAHRIGSHTLLDKKQYFLTIIALLLTLAGGNFFVILLTCGLFRACYLSDRRLRAWGILALGVILSLLFQGGDLFAQIGEEIVKEKGDLLIEGLKAGLLSFGGAYTAIPFLHADTVNIYPAVTEKVFLDGLALGNAIPAPLVIFATFLGYGAGGLTGAFLMTIGIFLPAFCFTLFGHEYLEKITENTKLSGFLDGVAAGVFGLLMITAFYLAMNAFTGFLNVVIFTAALIAFFRWKHQFATPYILGACAIFGLLIG